MAASDRCRLAPGFVPGPYDVICGRGKNCYGHEGNLNLRTMVRDYTKDYALAKSKDEKSVIVTSIAAEVRRLSPLGGFVKKDSHGWYEVGGFLAREKVSQCFRDMLESQYKSSTRMRRESRQERRRGSMEHVGSSTKNPTTTKTRRGNSTTPRSGTAVTTEVDRLAAKTGTSPFASTNAPQVVASNRTVSDSHHDDTATDAANKVLPDHSSHVVLEEDHQPPLAAHLAEIANGNSLYPHPSEISFYPLPLNSAIDMLDEISWSDVPGGSEHQLPDDSYLFLAHSSREHHSLPDGMQNDSNELYLSTTTPLGATTGNRNNDNDDDDDNYCHFRPPVHAQQQHGRRPASPSTTGQPSDCTSLPDLFQCRESGWSVLREFSRVLQAIDDDIDLTQQIQLDPWQSTMMASTAAVAVAATNAAADDTNDNQQHNHQEAFRHSTTATTIEPMSWHLERVFRSA